MSLPLNQIIQGDCVEVMQTFPKKSVDLVMFSPPYWGLRDYGVEGQIGLEKHPNEWIAKMVLVCGEVKRVLKKSGSLYLNVGDTYFGSGVHLPHHKTREGSLNYLNDFVEPKQKSWSKIKNKGWLQPKQKLLMPSRLAIALQHEGWILRNDIIWHKPNHMPSSVKDRLTCAYEHIFHFVKARRYFYDLDAIRQPHKVSSISRDKYGYKEAFLGRYTVPWEKRDHLEAKDGVLHPLGKNPSDIITLRSDAEERRKKWRENWQTTHAPRVYKSGPALGENPKGKNPSDIYFGDKHHWRNEDTIFGKNRGKEGHAKGKNPSDFWSINTRPFPQAHFAVYPEAICERPIKSSCPENGIVLDPMCGAGTTLVVAQKLGRRWIGIDLKAEYVEIAKQRLMKESQKLTEWTP